MPNLIHELSIQKLFQLLDCRFETSTLDFKETVDLSTAHGRVELTKDILAMANTKGGHIVIGVEDGTFRLVGSSQELVSHMPDGKSVNDKLGKYLGGHIAVHVAHHSVSSPSGQTVVTLLYVPESRYKVPAQDNGVYPSAGNPAKQTWCFRKGDVFIRKSDQSVRAETPEDLHRSAPKLKIVEVDEETVDEMHGNNVSRTDYPSATRGSLFPQQLTSFIGRTDEIETVQKLLEDARILTLTGAGGCGKTRLALKVAADNAGKFTDGVWIVDLSAISDQSLVPQVVASALNVREEANQTLTQTLTNRLQHKQLLLVIDNCEHMIDAAARLVDVLVKFCCGIQFLTTSREALAIDGEVTFRCPSLSVPDPTAALSLDSLLVFDAIKLFIARAMTVQPSFEVKADNAPTIAQICHRLDGIPLAIELAAARVKALSIEQISIRLDDRFRLLTGGRRTALPRQQTLRGAIDWSYELLSPAEKTVLRRISVFSGGWILEAAEAVCCGDELECWDIVDVLTQLVDKSLINFEEVPGSARYRMLETVRQYSQERLIEAGEEATVKDFHLRWYLSLAEQAETGLKGQDQVSWLNRLETEHDNLRGALGWCRDSGNADHFLSIVGSLWRFWYTRGYFEEGLNWLVEALEIGSNNTRTAARAKTLRAAGLLAQCKGDCVFARALSEESLAVRRELGDEKEIALALGNLGIIAYRQGDYEAARSLSEESLGMLRKLGDKRGVAADLNNLANVAFDQRDYEKAHQLFSESRDIWQFLSDQRGLSWALDGLGRTASIQGDHENAKFFLQHSLTGWVKIGHKQGIASTLESLAFLSLLKEDYMPAVMLFSAADRLRESLGVPIPTSEKEQYDNYIIRLKTQLGEDVFQTEWNKGQEVPTEQVVAEVLQP